MDNVADEYSYCTSCYRSISDVDGLQCSTCQDFSCIEHMFTFCDLTTVNTNAAMICVKCHNNKLDECECGSKIDECGRHCSCDQCKSIMYMHESCAHCSKCIHKPSDSNIRCFICWQDMLQLFTLKGIPSDLYKTIMTMDSKQMNHTSEVELRLSKRKYNMKQKHGFRILERFKRKCIYERTKSYNAALKIR